MRGAVILSVMPPVWGLFMLKGLIIEFQLTFKEWLEWKRKNLSPRRLSLLKVAEMSWLPLALLLALSVTLVSLRFVNVAPTISSKFPEWLPIVILVLLATARIYLSLFSNLRRRVLKKEWQSNIANLKCKVELTENGLDYVSGTSTYKPTWPEVASVFQTKQLLILCDDGEFVLLIPKRAFPSKKQLEEFLELAYQKTVIERNG
jgi:hypothetical protein